MAKPDPELVQTLRGLTEDDVIEALESSYVAEVFDGIVPVALLEFYNRMLDRAIGVPDD